MKTKNKGIASLTKLLESIMEENLVKTVSDLYEKAIFSKKGKKRVDDERLDELMELVVQKVGYTPEQKKKKGFNKFAFGGSPEFETLSAIQLKALIPLLNAVIARGYLNYNDSWNGKSIESEED